MLSSESPPDSRLNGLQDGWGTPAGRRVQGSVQSFHWASNHAWSNARSRRLQCPYVRDVSVVFGCAPLSSGLGLERLDLRRNPNHFQSNNLFSASNAAT